MLSLMINEDYVGSECCKKKKCFFSAESQPPFFFYVSNSGLYPFLVIISFNEVSTNFKSISRVYLGESF